MTRIIGIAIACVALGAFASREGFAADATYTITVTADATKSNGSPWDGVPGLGNTKANLNAAPDIAVCVVRKNTKPECIGRPDGRRLFSICQNQWTCKFPGITLGRLPVGLILVDLDVRNHDIIDTVILAGNEKVAADADIADSMRGAIAILTPNRSEDTKERAVRNAKLIPLVDCAGDKPCRLTQSELKLELTK